MKLLIHAVSQSAVCRYFSSAKPFRLNNFRFTNGLLKVADLYVHDILLFESILFCN